VTFKIGDKVVYPSQGAGIIDEVTKRVVLGEEQKYLKIVFIRGDMEVLVPLKKGQEVGLRHTIGKDELEQLKDTILRADLSLPEHWPPRYRAEQDILAAGNAYELARLIGVLTQRDLEKGLAATEREVLETAKEMLTSELAVVEEIDFSAAKGQLADFLAEQFS
jgi:CarD family transcriptional regulator